MLYMYESDSMRDVKKKADEILEVILETYGDLLEDVKKAEEVKGENAAGKNTENIVNTTNSGVNLDSDSINRLAEAIEKLCDSGVKLDNVQIVQNTSNTGNNIVGEGKPWPDRDKGAEVDTSIDAALGKTGKADNTGNTDKSSETGKIGKTGKTGNELTDLSESPFGSDSDDQEISFDDFNAGSDLLNMVGDI